MLQTSTIALHGLAVAVPKSVTVEPVFALGSRRHAAILIILLQPGKWGDGRGREIGSVLIAAKCLHSLAEALVLQMGNGQDVKDPWLFPSSTVKIDRE